MFRSYITEQRAVFFFGAKKETEHGKSGCGAEQEKRWMELWTNRQMVRGRGNVGRKNKNGSKTVKVKLSRYMPGVAQRVGRGIALLFHDRGIRRG